MADPKILYNNLFSNKLYSKSYDDFLEQYDNEEGVQKLHNKLSQNSLKIPMRLLKRLVSNKNNNHPHGNDYLKEMAILRSKK